MCLIVQKFGGTSVGDAERIHRAARRAIRAKLDGHSVVMVASAMSDTTAVALAAALRAEECEIYTDVDGIYTTDPRIVPEARKLDEISYDEMLELSSLGAQVMHSRSIELGKNYDVRIHVRSSLTDAQG